MSETKRSSFTGSIGFILAAAGSAVGLGNLWRFPYLAAQYGGGIFLLVYIILAVTFGFALMTTEIAIGRKTGKSVVQAYQVLDKRFGFLGYIAAIVPIIIFPYYSVIGGWVTKYIGAYVSGAADIAGDTFFTDFISSPAEPLVWFGIFLMLTAVVVFFGVEKGIEKVGKIMMPVLIVMILGITIYVLTLENTMSGLRYYLIPDFSKFSPKTVLAALGQLFYSMSLAMGIMITYGSYLKKSIDLNKCVNQIEIFDTGIAFFAGLMIIPAVASFSGVEGMNKGPGLMFITLPKIFAQMPAGRIVGLVFFVLVFFAAITSSISLMETIISFAMDKFNVSRPKACIVVFLIAFLMGIPSSLGNGIWSDITLLGMDFLTFFDFISNSILMPIVAFLTCILIGWVLDTKTVTDEVKYNGCKFGREKIYVVLIKYIAPVCIIAILVFAVLEGLGVITV
ncbi:MAG: sodium-dependent transporter [Clostridiales bacterium]|nr:sodium-dependent transporter [Clostridiales bacterium]